MTVTSTRHLLVALFLGALSAHAALWADPPIQVGRVSLISGEVSFRPGSIDEWVPATLNYPLTAGDYLWTDAGGRAEVHVGGAAIRLDSGTEFSFLDLDDQTVQVRLSQGSLNIRLRTLEAGDDFEIDTPNSSISLLTAGSYRIDVQDTGDTFVVVRQGELQVTAGEDAFNVPEGQSATVSGMGSIAYYLQDVPAQDDWDSWCARRDQREDRVASVRYVSRDMIGMEDLDDHGTWLVVAGYGQVWAPAGVPVGWAPYRYGRWAWIEPWGWTWIDDAPWGFAPFHYGRWAFVSRGWVWVPGTMVARPVYAPALVVFVGGDNWSPAAGNGIGWFPLGPHEVYIPPYTVSTTYVQRINITHVTNFQSVQRYDARRAVYVNRNVPQAVTVVHRDDFAHSRPTSRYAIAVPYAEMGRAPVMGMTAVVVPRRESVIAQPLTPQSRIVRPPEDVASRTVYSRRAPPPAQVPFDARQQAHQANPGRPLDREELAALQRNRPGSQPPVTVVNPGSINRVDNPPAYRGGQQVPPPRTAPAPGGTMIAPPPRTAPAPGGTMIAPPPRTAPAPGGTMRAPPPRTAPAPGGTMIAPSPRTVPAPGGTMIAPPARTAPAPGGTMIAPSPRTAPAPGGTMIAPPPRTVPAPGGSRIVPPSRTAPAPGGTMTAPPSRITPVVPPQVDRGQQDDRNQRVDRNQPGDRGQQGDQNQQGDRGQQSDRNQKVDPNQSRAASLISTLKTQSLPQAESDLAAAQKVAGVRLDFNAVSRQLASARASLTSAEKDLAGGNASLALQKATTVQKQISDVEKTISAAMKSGRSDQGDRKGSDRNDQGDDNRVKPRGGGGG
jgi:hypothetical protein